MGRTAVLLTFDDDPNPKTIEHHELRLEGSVARVRNIPAFVDDYKGIPSQPHVRSLRARRYPGWPAASPCRVCPGDRRAWTDALIVFPRIRRPQAAPPSISGRCPLVSRGRIVGQERNCLKGFNH